MVSLFGRWAHIVTNVPSQVILALKRRDFALDSDKPLMLEIGVLIAKQNNAMKTGRRIVVSAGTYKFEWERICPSLEDEFWLRLMLSCLEGCTLTGYCY